MENMKTAYPRCGYNGIVSGYHLHQGVCIDQFPQAYPGLFLQENPLSIPVYTVVQNAGLGEWLQRKLAGSQGGVMGQRVLMPEQALRRFAGGYPTARKLVSRDGEDPGVEGSTLFRGEGRGLLFMDGLKLTVYKALEEVLAKDDSLYESLRHYARGQDRRLWQLADNLAGMFYHYGMNCLPLVEAWDAGTDYPGLASNQRKVEAWQKGLWRRVFRDKAPYTHLSRVLSETMAAGDSYDGPEARIILFGSMFLGETGLRFFRHISRDLEVHHFLFTPSAIYAGAKLIPGTMLPPFLSNNGRLAADFASLLPDLSPDTVEWHSDTREPVSLLQRIREGLQSGQAFKGVVEDDGSIAIHDAAGIGRQVEVLKDRILTALWEDDSLAPTDIGVLASDIAAYAPYIESVFPGQVSGGADELTYNISGLPSRTEAPYPAAFASLISLVGSRFGRRELDGLFANACFTPCAGNPERAAAWIRMAEDLEVRWGADSKHRETSGAADPLTGSWEKAFRRLLCAYYYNEGDSPDILPAELSGDSEAETAGMLIHTLRSLDAGVRNQDKQSRALKEWVLDWENIIDTWLKPRADSEEDESDRLRIKAGIRDLMALDEDVASLEDFDNRDLSWEAFSSLLEELTSKMVSRRGRYLAQGVTCASLKPMRAIPFRRIYVLGLEEGAWPGRELLTGFDLRDSVEKAIDLSRESVDRFAFLETLFAASDHVSFFYSGRDSERGEPLSPASPLAELLDYIGHEWKVLLRVHPLVPFDPSALGGDERLQTSSPEALELARALAEGPPRAPRPDKLSDRPICIEGKTDNPGGEELVDWQELVAFLKDPIAFYYRGTLGIKPLYSEEEDDEYDVLEPALLDWWTWKNDVVSSEPWLLRKPEALTASFRDSLRLHGAVADTPFGELSGGRRLKEAEDLAAQLRRLESEGLETGEGFSLLLDPAAGTSEGSILPGGRLRVPAPLTLLEGGHRIRITGVIPSIGLLNTGSAGSTWTALEYISAKQMKFHHLLKGWVASLVVGSLEDRLRPSEFRVFHLGSREYPARRYFCGADPDPGSSAGSRRALVRPSETLAQLLRIREAARRVPLALHPEIADGLAAEEKSGLLDPPGLAAAAAVHWRRILENDRAPSRLRDSSYRRRFLDCPDFESTLFFEAWRDIYRGGGLA